MSEADLASQPHDAFFKEVFSEPANAAAFFQGHLPPAIVRKIDWHSLAVKPGSFIKQSLQQAHSDLLFTARAGDSEVLLYLLFEHQTTVDPQMPLRLLAYLLEIWQNHARQHGLPLPAVLPFVLHQGPERWTAATEFQDLLQLPADLAPSLLPFLPKFSHALLDLTQFDPDQEEHHEQIRIVLQLMKLARQKRLVDFFAWLVDQVTGPGSPLVVRGMNYAVNVDAHLDLDEVSRILQGNRELQDQAMTLAEKLIAKGEARGEAKGEAKGLWHGKIQTLEVVMGSTVTPIEALSKLDIEELQQRYEVLEAQYNTQFRKR